MGNSDPVVIVLDEMLGTAAAAPLRDRLLQARERDVTLDVSKVRHLGGLCAQVLLAAAITWRGAGQTVAFSGSSESFLGAVQTLGLTNHLSCEA